MRTCFILTIFFLLSAFSTLEFEKKHDKCLALLNHIPITVVAPASGINKGELTALKSIVALKLTIPQGCFDQRQSPFHANSDAMRFKYLKDALFDDANHVVWTLRGGYGSAKLIPDLQKLKKTTKEKFFIGFSDITALHIFLTQEWGWKTIHGSGIIEMLKDDKAPANFTKLAEIIAGKVHQVAVHQLFPINSVAQCNHTLNGKLTGGNITVLQTSIGTSWQIKTAGKIVFLEDVSIHPYQLDRALLHFKQAGLLQDVKAIIFGRCGSDNKDIVSTLNRFASTLPMPVFKTSRFGHGSINDPIIYNTASQVLPAHDGSFKLLMQL